MSIKAIPNQPVQFDISQSSCSVGSRPYLQLINLDDITQVQFDITPCLFSDNVVLNGAFIDTSNWITTDSFSIQNGAACKAAGAIGTLQQYNMFVTGNYYQIQVLVSSANEQMQIWNSNVQIGTITGVGNFTFSFRATGDSISIRSFSVTNEACIESIRAYEIDSRLIIALLDSNQNYIDSFSLADNPEYFKLSESKMTVNIVWEDFLDTTDIGCYYLGIADPCINTNGQNGIFNPSLQPNGDPDTGGFEVLTLGASALIMFQPYGLLYRGTAFAPDGRVELQDPYTELQPGLFYDYEIVTSPLYALNSVTIAIFLSGNGATNVGVSGGATITGTVQAGVAPGSPFIIRIDPTVTPAQILITSIKISLSNPSDDFVSNSTSVGFKRGTFDCSVLINSNCNEDVMGFDYENSLFSPRVRLEGELVNPTYPGLRTVFENSKGNRSVVYGERSKAKTLRLDLQPEYMLDYLSSLPYVDNLWVDGIKYVVQEDEIEPEYPNELVGHGKLSMSLIEDGTTIYNRNTNDRTNGNQAKLGFFLVDPRQNDLIVTEPSTGDTVEAL